MRNYRLMICEYKNKQIIENRCNFVFKMSDDTNEDVYHPRVNFEQLIYFLTYLLPL